MSLEDFSQFVLTLYRLSHELPLERFQDAALQHLRQALPFDSSMWGTATSRPDGIDIHTIHLHEQPPEMLASYEQIKHLDTAAVAAGLQPRATLAFNARDWFHHREQAPLREHGRRFEQANFFISSEHDPRTRFVHWLTLFRADERARCAGDEQRLLAALSPHVMQALAFNRIAHLDRLEASRRPAHGTAIADAHGVIYHADAGFESALRAEWAGWNGGTALPPALLDHLRRGQARYLGARAVVWHRLEQGLLFLGARPRCAADDLSPRELVIARLVAKGHTHKEIARLLERAPATIRNQIQGIYGKLGVGNIAGLVEALRPLD